MGMSLLFLAGIPIVRDIENDKDHIGSQGSNFSGTCHYTTAIVTAAG